MKDTDIAELFKKHARNFLVELAATTSAAEGGDEGAVETPAAKPGPKAAAKPGPKAAAKPGPKAAAAEASVTLPALRAKGLQLLQQQRGDELTALCAEFGAKSLSALAPEHFEEVSIRLDELLAV